jgi:dTDP-4-dehydrorhamnose reductase
VKVLILGAGGLTGRYLVKEAGRRGLEVAALPHTELDITRADSARAVLEKMKPDWIVNAAAFTRLEGCEVNPLQSRNINARAPAEWAKESGKSGIRFIHLSTDYVFDGKKETAYLPSDPVSPLSRYGKDKAEGEKQVLRANPDALVVRLAWVFGHGGKTFMSQLPTILAEREVVEVAGGRAGSCTYAGEAARLIFDLAARGAREIYHAVGAGQVTWKIFAEKTIEQMRNRNQRVACREIRELSVELIPGLHASRPAFSVLDISMTEKLLGRKIPSWEQGLEEYLAEIGLSRI